MDEIGIKGLRSLVNTKNVTIKPINILVGTNSSGKSTFLRTFPLLRQSVERKTRGPILWNGIYTDFESFKTSLHNDTSSDLPRDLIEFTFKFPFKDNKWRHPIQTEEMLDLTATVSVRRGSTKNSCYTCKYALKIDSHKLIFDFEEDGTITAVTSTRFNWELKKSDLKFQRTDTDSLLPIIKLPDFRRLHFEEKNDKITTIIYRQIKSQIRDYTGSKSDNKINRIANTLISRLYTDKDKLKLMKSISSTKKWKGVVESWSLNNKSFQFLSGLIDLFTVMENSAEINTQLSKCFKNVRYIAPLRASTERYYRYQDLSVDELDHRGENIGMFLSNIPRKWRGKFDSWTKDNFGFVIQEKVSPGHIAIELEYQDSNASDNVADMGFGFSQILPVITQLWSVASGYEKSMKGSSDKPFIFAIEQPELHLHPKMQAALASVFSDSINLAKENKIDLRLIIETHSPSMISKLGDLISLGEASKDNINVLLFEQNRRTRSTNLSYSHFNTDGELEQWPAGFFAY